MSENSTPNKQQSLRVAPCPTCQNSVVMGERACRHCRQSFNYGEPAPVVPTREQIIFALQQHQKQQAPKQEVVQPKNENTQQPIEGLIDSRLFGAQELPEVEVGTMIDLESFYDANLSISQESSYEVDSSLRELLETRHASVEVEHELVPGLIDSELFAHFVPEDLEIEKMQEVEHISEHRIWNIKAEILEALETCNECGTSMQTDQMRCPSCGAKRP